MGESIDHEDNFRVPGLHEDGQRDLRSDPIAIVGIGLRFAGGATDPTSFWSNLCVGKDCITEVPADRWNTEAHYIPGESRRSKSKTKWGGFVDDVVDFDAEFFGISPREADTLDPQQRMLLEVSWNALEDAGIAAGELRASRTGVYIGGFTLDYMIMQLGGTQYQNVEPHTATGSMMTLLSNRLSYVYGLQGPSLSVDTACSSSLVAVHLACQGLRTGECEVALAGGVNALLAPGYFIAESQAGMLSPTGRSRAFDSRADGYVRGEGAGVVVLKKMSSALRDGDRIYAVIRASAVNQDGHSEGLTVPSGDAQSALMREAYAKAGVAPHEVRFVEAHGTGTPVGDPIEAKAIGSVVGTGRPTGSNCYLGSVKTNIGHTEAAAGVAGLIKAALSLYHRALPPHVHLERVNPAIDLAGLGLTIPRGLTPLSGATEQLIAGVNSFGFGGTNAHVVLQAAEPGAIVGSAPPSAMLLPLSARSAAALRELAERYAQHVEALVTPQSVAAFVRSVALRRDHHALRAAIVATDVEEMRRALRAIARGETDPGAVTLDSEDPTRELGSVDPVWVFTGMGPQWWGMGQELYSQEPVFRAALDRVCARFAQVAGWSLLDEMRKTEGDSRMHETQVAQPANFALQIALAELWRSWGLRPAAVVGHSAGEPAAAYVAGALSLEDAVDVIHHRSRLQQQTTGSGRLIAVGLSEQAARERIADHDSRRLSIAAVNSPTAVTIAGDNTAIERLRERLEAEQVFAKVMRVDVPYHSHIMEPLREAILENLAHIEPCPATIPLYSTVLASRVEGAELDAGYWYRNVREPVRFFAAAAALVGDGHTCFLELGPHPVLGGSLSETFAHLGRVGYSVGSLRRGEAEPSRLRHALASLYVRGADLDWPAIHAADQPESFVGYPLYPWQRVRYWNEPPELKAVRLTRAAHPVLSRRLEGPAPSWEIDITTAALSYIQDHQLQGAVVFPAAAYVEMVFAAVRELYGDVTAVELRDISLHKALYLDTDAPKSLRFDFDADTGRFIVHSRHADAAAGLWDSNASGRVLVRHARSPAVENLAAVRARCRRELSQAHCYRHFRRLGLEYGPAFQGIDLAWQGDGEALARVELAPEILADVDDYIIHPVLFDVCLQTMIATLPMDADAPPQVYMPVSLGRVRLFGQPSGELFVHARLSAHNARELRCDVQLVDADGEVLGVIENCRARAVGEAHGAHHGRAQNLYELAWREQPLTGSGASELSGGMWLIFGDGNELERSLVSQLAHHGQHCVIARTGDGFSHQGDEYTVSPGAQDDYVSLIQDILRDSAQPLRGIVYLWPAETTRDVIAAPEATDGALDRICVGMLHLLRTLARLEWSEPPRIWAVTRAGQAVNGEAREMNVLQSALWGLSRVAGEVEHRELWGAIIDLDPHVSAADAEQVFAELTATDGEDQVAYRLGSRHVARLARCDQHRMPTPPSFRSDASYLITGGLGALGLATARWMVKRGARHLILVGREGLPPRAQWRSLPVSDRAYRRVQAVRELEALGASIATASVDIANTEMLQRYVDAYENEDRPLISGVVHAAGVAQPQLIVDLDAESFRRTLRPKLHGALSLHRAFAERELDFFVMYSSIAALLVSNGQANYSAANAFLDAFAHWRHANGQGGLSINWGPWGEVGMAADLELVDFFERRGFYAMSTAQGLDALGALLGGRVAQAAVLAADWPRMAEIGFPPGAAPPVMAEVLAEAASSDSADDSDTHDDGDFLLGYLDIDDADARRAALEDFVMGLAGRVLRIDSNKLRRDDTLNAHGLDSMMAIELKHRIERNLHVNVAIVDLLRGASAASIAEKLSIELETGLIASMAMLDTGAGVNSDAATSVIEVVRLD